MEEGVFKGFGYGDVSSSALFWWHVLQLNPWREKKWRSLGWSPPLALLPLPPPPLLGTRGLSHIQKLPPPPKTGKERKHVFPGLVFHIASLLSYIRDFCPPCTREHACGRQTETYACMHLMHTQGHTHTSELKRPLASLFVCFTHQFCSVPWVFRAMLCVVSSQPPSLHGLRRLGVAGCGYACWVLLTTTWWITFQLCPKRDTHTHTHRSPTRHSY